MSEREYHHSSLQRELVFFGVTFVLCGLAEHANTTFGGLCFALWLLVAGMRLLTIALAYVVAGLHITSGIIYDCVMALKGFYDVTFGPLFRLMRGVARLVPRPERDDGQAHARTRADEAAEARHREQQRQQQADQAAQEERFRQRQEQIRREREARERDEAKQRADEQARRSKARSPWEVLGVPIGCDLETARRAYRELSKKYHPDRVHDLGVEFQEMANTRFQEIQAAWEKIQAMS